MADLLVKLCNVTRPISGRVDFQRWKAAHPNMAGRDFKGNEIPSFRPPYLVDESSDMIAISEENPALDEAITAQFFADMEGRGFKSIGFA